MKAKVETVNEEDGTQTHFVNYNGRILYGCAMNKEQCKFYCKAFNKGLYEGQTEIGGIMKKPNITKGEWEIIETKNGDLLIVADDLIVCRINELAELTDPNAKAISAVPDMISASIDLIDKLKSQKLSPNTWVYYSRLEKALEKAGVEL